MLEIILDYISNLNGGKFSFNWSGVLSSVLNCANNPNNFLCQLSTVVGQLNLNANNFTGAASNPIAAAFATQGYYQQELLLEMLNKGGALFGLAPLLYILSAIGGLIMLALGSPPKLYLWFLMGPALYLVFFNWREDSMGNRYQIGSRLMPYEHVIEILSSNPPSVSGSIDFKGTTIVTYEDPASVSAIFAYIDWAVSSAVQSIITAFTPLLSYDTMDPDADIESLWYQIGDYRWKLLESITSAKLSQADIRDSFITFLSSECGNVLRTYLSYPRYFAARNAKNSIPPDSVFIGTYQDLVRDLTYTTVPTPLSIKGLLKDIYRNSNVGTSNELFSFAVSTMGTNSSNFRNLLTSTEIRCSELLRIIAASIRAEAGYAFAKLISQAPVLIPRFKLKNSVFDAMLDLIQPDDIAPITPSELGREIFGYWNLPFVNGLKLNLGLGDLSINISGSTTLGVPLSFLNGLNNRGDQGNDEGWMQFLIDVITAYIFKNELLFAPPLVNDSGGDPNTYTTAATANIASVGSASKFGELYVWSQMLPKVQGLLLYWLALGFPLAVVLMVVPNFQTAVITWTLFWAWVKSWDIGFALIKRIEPTLWGLVGNSEFLADTLMMVSMPPDKSLKTGFSSLTNVQVFCFADGASKPSSWPPCMPDTVPLTFVRSAETKGGITFAEAVATLDVGLSTHNALWLEEGNAFYLYLIAALYFAVPVIMGQLILGSKASFANIVKDFTGGITGDAARAAGQAYASQRQAQAQAVGASFGQAEMLKSMRQQGLAARAIAAQNMALRNQIASAIIDKSVEGIQGETEMVKLAMNRSALNAQGQVKKFSFPITLGSAVAATGVGNAGSTILSFFVGDAALQNLFAGPNPNLSQPNANEIVRRVEKVLTDFNPQTLYHRISNAVTGQDSGVAVGRPGQSGFRAEGFGQQSLFEVASTDGQAGRPAPGAAGAGAGGGAASGGAGGTAPTVAGALANAGRGVVTGGAFAAYATLGIIRQLGDEVAGQYKILTDIHSADLTATASAMMAERKLESARLNLQGSVYNQEANRLQSATAFQAQNDAWLARANYANAVNPILSAYGANTVAIGEKPADAMGASWLGQLGEVTENAAKLVDSTSPNTFFTDINTGFVNLKSRYGEAQLYNKYLGSQHREAQALGLGAVSLVFPGGAVNTGTEQLTNNWFINR